MPRRVGFWGLLSALFFLILLSALIETPASHEAQRSERWIPVYHAALLPEPSLQEQPQTSPLPSYGIRPVIAGVFVLLFGSLTAVCRDANGRWIQKKRYVDSVYQVFRQEVACG